MEPLKKHILVIDNEAQMRSSLKLLLNTEGYTVSVAENGKVALEMILKAIQKNHSIDLLILDIQMPIMNGLELADTLKQRHITIPTLIITGYEDKKVLKELFDRNCKQFLNKPFNEKALISKVKEFF